MHLVSQQMQANDFHIIDYLTKKQFQNTFLPWHTRIDNSIGGGGGIFIYS